MSATNEQQTDHELMHPAGDVPAWSESYYFNFVDPKTKLGMFTRMGFRPGDGWADALHAIYLPGSRVAFTYGRRDIGLDLAAYNNDLTAGDLTITLSESHKRWRLNYDGPAQDIADAAVLLQRKKLRPEGWFNPATMKMDLDFECITQPHFTFSDQANAGAFGHFEQSGKVTGEIQIDGERWQVEGYGVRDKSWGPRDWGANQRKKEDSKSSNSAPTFSSPANPLPFVNWFSMNFGPDSALGGSCFPHPSGELKGAGWIQRDGKSLGLTDVTIATEYQPNSILHKAVHLRGTIEGGEPIDITGEIINMCPTKVPMPGGATFINEGLAEFNWNGTQGFGIAEHWHAISK